LHSPLYNRMTRIAAIFVAEAEDITARR
jgi:hypothetical protein